jgi:hypothetical protein
MGFTGYCLIGTVVSSPMGYIFHIRPGNTPPNQKKTGKEPMEFERIAVIGASIAHVAALASYKTQLGEERRSGQV